MKYRPNLFTCVAHIPWHGDIHYTGEPISEETREYGKQLLSLFTCKVKIIKLLELIDEDNGISRGTVRSQSVEAIVVSTAQS